ncbi:MAG TPA: hypothetical protein VKB46_10895 [Pyrinomonadaceae bacterium]|nr:hypothetical protein [Pyrinomonadaceae bacterium]
MLLPTARSQAQQANSNTSPLTVEEVKETSADLPRRLIFAKRDSDLNRAYADVFTILSKQNTCSSFYGGSYLATTVLNSFVTLVRPEPLLREVSFQMDGKPLVIINVAAGVSYRLFAKARVNSNGSFYQRRQDTHKYPSYIGSFGPGTRRARALILLHELAHLIPGPNGGWLIPDDGHNGPQSTANTFHVQQVCQVQLEELK